MEESGSTSASASASAAVSENAVEVKEVNEQIQKLEQKITDVESEIKKLDRKITDVEDEIKKLDRAIDAATTPEVIRQLREKELKLRDEKSQLREKELKLLEDKRQLREEKLVLLKQNNLDFVSTKQDADRLIGIDYKIAEQALKHSFDLKRFMNRVNELFQWWEKGGEFGFKNYMAPYFPCVQSSGMGKTKLLSEAHIKIMTDGEQNDETKDDTKNKKRNADEDEDDDDGSHIQKTSSALILCRPNSPSTPDDKPAIYTHVLVVPQTLGIDSRTQICDQLNWILKDIQEKTTATTANTPTKSVAKSKVVFFLDEAQHLLTNDAFGFRCVRWWLRSTERPPNTQVAAVFAGTSSGLANFYRDDPAVTRDSRGAEDTYQNSGSKLFEPFFDLCTMGVFVKRTPTTDAEDSDYARAIPYGRPLFALLKQDGKLMADKERVILRRMTLSVHAWFEDDEACLSVLGTRVQMGQTSLSIASQLVKKGYANLTYFCGSAQIAQIAYLPDPVCARLAMCVMDPAWRMDQEGMLHGQQKKDWSAKMGKIISTGLCRPHKGNLGEIASALYLLFCGDMLRATDCKSGESYHTFQVPVLQFLQVAFAPAEDSPSTNASTTKASVSFIQVCRSHVRPSFSEMFLSSSLEWLYHAACACYCYEGCPAIDWYAPIRCPVEEGKPIFVPLVVSVKARRTMSKPERIAALAAMGTVVKEGPLKAGICVLFLIGLDKPQSIESGFCNDKGKKIDTPTELDMSLIYYVQVSVQSGDTFGLSDVVTQTTLDGDAQAEVYTSHGFLHAYSRSDTVQVQSLIRTKAKKESKESVYIRQLCKALGQIDVDA